MASFLSRTNTREDGYGGAREQRVRLPLEVLAAVRARVGPDYVVGCRYLADECIDGGSSVDEAMFFGVEFARGTMDFISTSRGGKFDDAKQPNVGAAAYPYTGPSGYECMPQYISDERGPFGRNMAPTAQIRRAIRTGGLRHTRSSAPAACTISKWRSVCLPRRPATSSARRGNHLPIPIGFSSFPAEKDERCGPALIATIAKPSIRNTNRSPANSGIERASMLPAWH